MTTIEQHAYLLATAKADHPILWDRGEIITMLSNYHSLIVLYVHMSIY